MRVKLPAVTRGSVLECVRRILHGGLSLWNQRHLLELLHNLRGWSDSSLLSWLWLTWCHVLLLHERGVRQIVCSVRVYRPWFISHKNGSRLSSLVVRGSVLNLSVCLLWNWSECSIPSGLERHTRVHDRLEHVVLRATRDNLL